MKSLIAWLAIFLLAGQLFGQEQELVPWKVQDKLPNQGQAIGIGAIDAYALRKQVDSLQEEVRRLTGENEALRAQLRATKQPEPTPAKLAKIVSTPGCLGCPKIKAWLKPWLIKRGYGVGEISEDIQPKRIYPYVEICTDNGCRIIQLPNVETPFTPEWFELQLKEQLR